VLRASRLQDCDAYNNCVTILAIPSSVVSFIVRWRERLCRVCARTRGRRRRPTRTNEPRQVSTRSRSCSHYQPPASQHQHGE